MNADIKQGNYNSAISEGTTWIVMSRDTSSGANKPIDKSNNVTMLVKTGGCSTAAVVANPDKIKLFTNDSDKQYQSCVNDILHAMTIIGLSCRM